MFICKNSEQNLLIKKVPFFVIKINFKQGKAQKNKTSNNKPFWQQQNLYCYNFFFVYLNQTTTTTNYLAMDRKEENKSLLKLNVRKRFNQNWSKNAKRRENEVIYQ